MIEIQRLVGRLLPSESCRPGIPSSVLRHGRHLKGPPNCFGKRTGISMLCKETVYSFSHELGNGPNPGGRHGEPARQRISKCYSEAFHGGRMDERRGKPIRSVQDRFMSIASKNNPVGYSQFPGQACIGRYVATTN